MLWHDEMGISKCPASNGHKLAFKKSSRPGHPQLIYRTVDCTHHHLTMVWDTTEQPHRAPNTSKCRGLLIRSQTQQSDFQMPLDIFPYMTKSWFSQTWYQCWLLHIEIIMDTVDFKWPRWDDKEIMHIFIQHGIRGTELASRNRCRMYLHAIYLSDICTRDRKAINSRFWDGREQCHLTLRWPRTDCPTVSEWNNWCKTLMMALSWGQRDSLANHLGNWTWTQGQQDAFFVETDGDHLVQKNRGQWYIYTKIPSQCCKQWFHETACLLPSVEVADNMWRAQVSIKHNVIIVMGRAPIEQF